MKEATMPTDNRQKLLIIVAIAAGALFFGDKFVLTPLMDFIKSFI